MTTPILSGPEQRLRTNTFWGVAASGGYALGRFGVFVIPAKYLPAEQVGWFGLALAVVTPLAYLLHLELRLAWVTDRSPDASLRQYAAVRILGNLILLALTAGAWLAGHNWRPGPLWLLLVLVALVRVVESWSDLCLGQMQKQECMRQAAISHILKSALLLGWAIIVSLGGWDIFWLPVGWVVIILLVWQLYDVGQAGGKEALRPDWSGVAIKRLVKIGWPLGVFMAMTGLNDTIIRSAVKFTLNPSAVAYITAMTMFVTALVVVQNGVNQAALPRLARYYTGDLRSFNHLLRLILLPAVCGGVVFILLAGVWGNQLLRWVYRQEYAQHSQVLFWVSISGLFLLVSMVWGDALVACRRFTWRMVSVAVGAGVTGLVGPLLVNGHGLTGAAWALTLSSGVSMLISGVGVYVARLTVERATS